MYILKRLCSKVDEVTGMRRRVQKMFEIQESLEFPLQMTQLSLASQNRWLVKKGTLIQQGSTLLNTIGKKAGFKKSGTALTIFLFNDLIILAKKKSEEYHVVRDYGQRPGVELSLIQGVEDSPGYYTLFLTIAKNHMGETVNVFLSCALESERDDWLNAMKRTSDEYHGL